MQNIIFYTLIKKIELTEFNGISIIFFYLDLDFKNPVILVRSLQEHYSLHTISLFFLEKCDLAIARPQYNDSQCGGHQKVARWSRVQIPAAAKIFFPNGLKSTSMS